MLRGILNKVNMYRLAIYYLASLVVFAFVLSLINVLPYNPAYIAFSTGYLVLVAWLSNLLFAKIVKTHANTESAVITALILALITGPMSLTGNILLYTFIAVAAMASKYILAWRAKHIFNPAAVAMVAAAFILNQGASWWVGIAPLAPLILIFGLIVIKKIRRGHLVLTFLLTYFVLLFLINAENFDSISSASRFAWQILTSSPILFFAFIMLPEPLTSPLRTKARIYYAALTAAVVVILQTYLLSIPYTLELALLVGNIFAYVISHDRQVKLTLKKRQEFAPNIVGFWFQPASAINFIPGQFLQWTVYHPKADSRGIRRYFSIASSPTEPELLITAKFPAEPSSFKKALLNLKPGEEIPVTGLEGEFMLPKEQTKKLLFIAGGIGITPFRSMIKYLQDQNMDRDIVLIYSASSEEEFVFGDIWQQFQKNSALKTVRTISDLKKVPQNWQGETGIINAEMIQKVAPDWQQRLFYVSGPDPMVRTMENTLLQMGVDRRNIQKDYFPGYEEL